MKQLAVKNYNNLAEQKIEQNGNEFIVKYVFPTTEAKQCNLSVVEVEPGNYAWGYHYHEMNEEVFYIISGKGTIRTINAEINVKAGDIITFPTGEEGSHVISNASKDEKLVYLDFDTANPAEIVHFPDINKIMAIGPYSNGMYDINA